MSNRIVEQGGFAPLYKQMAKSIGLGLSSSTFLFDIFIFLSLSSSIVCLTYSSSHCFIFSKSRLAGRLEQLVVDTDNALMEVGRINGVSQKIW